MVNHTFINLNIKCSVCTDGTYVDIYVVLRYALHTLYALMLMFDEWENVYLCCTGTAVVRRSLQTFQITALEQQTVLG